MTQYFAVYIFLNPGIQDNYLIFFTIEGRPDGHQPQRHGERHRQRVVQDYFVFLCDKSRCLYRFQK